MQRSCFTCAGGAFSKAVGPVIPIKPDHAVTVNRDQVDITVVIEIIQDLVLRVK